MAATIWKGLLEFGDLRIPVRFHSAVQDNSIRFHLLHKKDKVRVRQAMVNPETGDIVPNDRIRRGFEVAEDTFVLIDDNELDQLEPKESRSIRVESFVPSEQTNHQWYERAYYLGSDGNEADYSALVAALSDQNIEGVSRWVMRKRSYIGSLQASHGILLMVSLRHADEVIPASSLPTPSGRTLSSKELTLAEQLVKALHTDFDPDQYKDEYRERVLDFIKAKAKGHRPRLRLVRPPKATDPEDLSDVLAASMRKLKGRKSA